MTDEENKEATDAESTSEENQEKEETQEEGTSQEGTQEQDSSEEKSTEEKSEDTDFKKELDDLEAKQPPKRSEKEKAQYTVSKIYERFPDLKPAEKEEESIEDDKFSSLENRLIRNQVEGIFRGNSKNEEEVKFKMFFYDNRIQRTGNIHQDADDANWLANKHRTRNAIQEGNRKPDSQGESTGAGQKSPSNTPPELPAEEIQKMQQLGLKKIAADRWEGKKAGMKYNFQTKVWEGYIKK